MTKALTPPLATKRVFRVTACFIDRPTILIEATSHAEAIELAKHIGGCYFEWSEYDSDWEIEGAESVEDFDPDRLAPAEAYDSL
jgi:hypothetical protein